MPLKPKLQFYPTSYPSDEEDNTPTLRPTNTAYHRHIHFNTVGTGARNTYIPSAPSPSKRPASDSPEPPEWNTDPLPNIDSHPYIDPAYQHELDLMDCELPKRKRTKSDTPLLNWIPDVDIFLKEILRMEGRGDYAAQEECPFCTEDRGPAEYRCEDCFGNELYCKGCILLLHSRNPLHRIKASCLLEAKWNSMFFERVTLKSMGLRVQLGHSVSDCCPNPEQAYKNGFTVLDLSGVHQVHVDYCSCQTAQPRHIQLLRCSWYPATTSNPRTATTFRLLEHFHILTFESKASGFALYNTLSRLTDNTGTAPPPDRYLGFMRMVREWRHIKMLKRAGRGHQPEGPGPSTASQGDCAVVCPACPHPGRNIPVDWTEDKDNKWLYALFLAIDANFRLKRKDVSSDAADPSLNRGRAYFVEEHRYKAHLAGYGDQEETKSDCVNHDAVKSANKFTAGLAATGAGTVDCARHNMKRPHAVGDLQAGESLLGTAMLILNISYDICCQWGVHLRTRMLKYPEEYWIDLAHVQWTFLVPKFHLPAHVERCQTAFSFNFTRFVGRTDGEAPERGWADINAVATSTQEMGPGSRRDTLDDHFGDWNHRKVVAMAPTFLRKIKTAVPERAEQVEIFEDLSAGLQPQSVATWTVAVEAWEKDKSQPNPFVSLADVVTEREIRLELAREEARELLSGEANALHHTLSPAVCLTVGIDFEIQQRRLGIAMSELNENSTSVQRTKVQLRDNSLRRKITSWMKIQEVYMPATAFIRAVDPDTTAEGAAEIPAHAIPLLLPSALPRGSSIDVKFPQYELRLRHAQARDAIYTLRRELRLQAHLFNVKFRFSRGQSQNTRSMDTITRVRDKVAEAAARYRTARTAIASLARQLHETGWAKAFPILQDEDIRQMAVGLEGESEGKRTLSWIWTSAGVGGEQDTVDSAQEELRIEWCKARARAYRWSEEVFLLLEEMTRVKKYHTWHADWWEQQSVARDGLTPAESEGFAAYAFRQSHIRIAMREACELAWQDVEKYVQLGGQLDEGAVTAAPADDDDDAESIDELTTDELPVMTTE
ncbi:hypothetical protein HWV62_37111 [Athelia sp. TMB]|nr:hypothetical protein HWV62_37111 [Athelia sp. TMB]